MTDTGSNNTTGDTPEQRARLTQDLATTLAELALGLSVNITTAESCTGGLVAAALTAVPGSSAWFRQGVVTYSNEAKMSLLNVPAGVLERHGAVSEACVLAMVTGALRASSARVAVSVSGVAGPGGGSAAKPVGCVWIGWAVDEQLSAAVFQLSGDRRSVREQAVVKALHGIIERLNSMEITHT